MSNILVITGQTGSGKTKKAIEYATSNPNYEIINCDTIQMYKYFTIGSAKGKITPKNDDLCKFSIDNQTFEAKKYKNSNTTVWLIDDLEPDFQINVVTYQKIVRTLIQNIHERKKNVILVGGSGYYLSAVLYRYNFSFHENNVDKYKNLSLAELYIELKKNNINYSFLNQSDIKNPRRLINLLLRGSQEKQQNLKFEKYYNFDLIVTKIDEHILLNKLANRVEYMFKNGFVDECKYILSNFSQTMINNLRFAVGYKEVFDFLESKDKITLKELKHKVLQSHIKLTKKQLRWIKKYL